MMIGSLNTGTGKLTTISLPRDLWIPDLSTKINSLYFVVRDKESYFHAENKLAERYMIALTLVDPKWQGEYGQKLRFYLRNHRKPN